MRGNLPQNVVQGGAHHHKCKESAVVTEDRGQEYQANKHKMWGGREKGGKRRPKAFYARKQTAPPELTSASSVHKIRDSSRTIIEKWKNGIETN